MENKFYICRHCGNLIHFVNNAGVVIKCCGEKMHELIPNTTEAAGEKHLPVISIKDGALHVSVGEVTHPMSEDHSIQWVFVETEKGGFFKFFSPTDTPDAEFCLRGCKPVAVYAYCNLHGLWKTEVK